MFANITATHVSEIRIATKGCFCKGSECLFWKGPKAGLGREQNRSRNADEQGRQRVGKQREVRKGQQAQGGLKEGSGLGGTNRCLEDGKRTRGRMLEDETKIRKGGLEGSSG